MFRLCFLFLFAFFAVKAQVKEVYVAVNGSDRNIGSAASPFKTLDKALQFSKSAGSKSVRIHVKAGVHYLDKTLVIKSEDFKNTSVQIIGEQNAVISAGRRLTLKWRPYKDGIYVAVLPDGQGFERLYVNGELKPLARFPDHDAAARVFHGTSKDAISPERVSRWRDPAGGYVHALHEHEWGGFHYLIKGKKADGTLDLTGGWQNNRPSGMHKEYRFVENIFEELDAPGEWFADKKENKLYYYPEKGTDINKVIVEVSHLKNSIELKGSLAQPLQNIELKNLRFVHNERSFMDTREPLVRSDWTIYRGGAVLLEGTEYCKITDCTFNGIGGNAIFFSYYNKGAVVSGCHISRIGANAVAFVGDPEAVRSPSFRYEDYVPYDKMDKTPGPKTQNFPQECVVTDNLFHHLGEIEKQATGVLIEMSASITAGHNTIYHTPRAGINIGDGAWGGHVIEFNDVFETVLETGDHGAFNSWGRDRFWAPGRKYMDSLVAKHPELILLDAVKPVILRNNRFRCDHGWDIDLDDGSSNYEIYNNVCLNGGLKLREGFYRKVTNNILVNNSFHPHVWFLNSGDVFEHNIVMKKYFPIRVDSWGERIDHNLFPDEAARSEARKNGTDGNSLFGDPMFRNASKGDYSVSDNSPALKLGFRNFPMDYFGVRKASLKQIAAKPEIPRLSTNENLAKGIEEAFLGGIIKNVEGLGDRSAYGLPDETGVVIVSAATNSLLYKSGLRERDVIRSADNEPVKSMKDLLDIHRSANWKGKVEVEFYRDQQWRKGVMLLK